MDMMWAKRFPVMNIYRNNMNTKWLWIRKIDIRIKKVLVPKILPVGPTLFCWHDFSVADFLLELGQFNKF